MGILSAFRFAFQNLFFTPVLYKVIASLAIFTASWQQGDRLKDALTDKFRNHEETFDFIIVGAGTSGSILANRLSQWYSVLLLEAGGEPHPFQSIPAFSLFLQNYEATDYRHRSVPQTQTCLACKNCQFKYSQGIGLGGTSNLNYLIHLRGSPNDYNHWADILQDPSWSYDSLLPYFKASEHYHGISSDPDAHGKNGPIYIQTPDYTGLANEWNWGMKEMGYAHVDLNGHFYEGSDTIKYPTKAGLRRSAYKGFIQPARSRGKLNVRKFSEVKKVLLNDENVAQGVLYFRHGRKRIAFAKKEIILSAGALQTPKILFKSGIGPAPHLQQLKVPLKVDLPVGKNFQDHFSTILGPFCINNAAKGFSIDKDVSTSSFLKFKAEGQGPLTSSGFQATSLLTSTVAQTNGQPNWPDIQLTLFGLSPHQTFSSDMANAFGIRESLLRKYYSTAINARQPAFFIFVSATRPYSRGDVCLTKQDKLQINPNYLSDPLGLDLKVMLEGIHRALHLAENTTTFQTLGTTYHQKSFPGCEKHWFRSDSYWECYIRHFSISMNDYVGTTALGAVVDSHFKVIGTKNLRVVDAGVIPVVPGANIEAPTMMIAQRAASDIVHEWKRKKSLTGVQPPLLNSPISTIRPVFRTPIESSSFPPTIQNRPHIVSSTPGPGPFLPDTVADHHMSLITPPPISVQKINDYAIFQQHDTPAGPGFSTEVNIPSTRDSFFTTERPNGFELQAWGHSVSPVTIRSLGTPTTQVYAVTEAPTSKPRGENRQKSSTVRYSSSTSLSFEKNRISPITRKPVGRLVRRKKQKKQNVVKISSKAESGHRKITRVKQQRQVPPSLVNFPVAANSAEKLGATINHVPTPTPPSFVKIKPASVTSVQSDKSEVLDYISSKYQVPSGVVVIRRRKKKPKVTTTTTLKQFISSSTTRANKLSKNLPKSQNSFWQRYIGDRYKKFAESYRPKVIQKRKTEDFMGKNEIIILQDVDIMKMKNDKKSRCSFNAFCIQNLMSNKTLENDSKVIIKMHPFVPLDMNPEPQILLPTFANNVTENSSNDGFSNDDDDSDEIMMSMS